ncbi:MAG TPA: acetate kinase [Bacilli bacterium]|nr:acetate kinase [Bacilli bacterium]HPA98754.1 acetate kinase [Bacilli bacterium]HQO93966.1 acetate kinase [Bacilli bacterium]HQQ39217.1 acetate kinase [Bacilli bacterium]
MAKIMAVNAGSSSLKFKLLELPEEKVITNGVVERIGLDDAIYSITVNGKKEKQVLAIKDHAVAVKLVLDDLVKRQIVKCLDEIEGVGHRVVQGGWYFKDSALVTDDVIKKIEKLSVLAPLHNPAHVVGIKAFQKALPDVSQVVVFDTSFHQTMEPETYMYATPYEWYEKHHIRKYGAHGTSHKYVAGVCLDLLKKKNAKIVTLHIGNGASLAAVKNGKVVDTTMGLTPLEGIPMGTRSGNIDPTVLQVINEKEGLSIQELIYILNNKSGYLGVSGVSHDSRDVEEAMDAGNKRAKLALDIQFKRIADYIGSYYVLMGGLDAIVFTAGIGENSWYCRQEISRRLKVLGVEIDEEFNKKTRGQLKELSTPKSKVKVYIIPTDEEVMIARDVVRIVKKAK